MRKWTAVLGTGVFSACLMVASSGLAQVGVFGGFSGAVTDTSGALIPGAHVKLTNSATGVSQETSTDSSGVYQFVNLAPGTYDITVSYQGFSTETKSNLVLLVNQLAKIDFVMRPGSVTQQITVASEAPLVNTVNSTVGTVVEHQQVVSLPLNGRQFTQLILLTPGAAPRGNSQQAAYEDASNYGMISPAVNGNRPDTNNFTIDGVENNELMFNTPALNPPPDALEEFTVQTFITSGGFGRAPGANVNIVTRSGTNQIHGGAWEFLRNDIFDSRNFFNPTRPEFRQNQFGADIGTPIIKDKLWTFGWYEGFRKILGGSALAVVPTPAMLNGDLSSLPQRIYNPYTTTQTGTDAQGNPIFTRAAFPNNHIPSDLLNPISVAVAQRTYPAPNIPNAAPGAANYLNTQPTTTNYDQWSDRVDAVLPKDTRFFSRFSWNKASLIKPNAGVPVAPINEINTAVQAVAGVTKSLNPTTVVDFHAQYLRTYLDDVRPSFPLSFLSSSGLLRDFPGQKDAPPCQPNIAISDVAGMPGCFFSPFLINNFEVNGSLTKTSGKQTITAGTEIFKSAEFIDCAYADAGFEPPQTADPQNLSNTGSGFASFLLGIPDSGDREAGDGGQFVGGEVYSFWFNDQIRVSPKLTVTVGLRYDYAGPLGDSRGRSGAPDWETSTATNVVYLVDKNALNFPSEISTPDHTLHTSVPPFTVQLANNGLFVTDKTDFGPRLGIAYQMPRGFVLRTGGAIFYEFNQSQFQSKTDFEGQFPFGFPFFTPSGLNSPTAANPTPTGVLGQGNIFPPVVFSYTPSTGTGFAIIPHQHTPYVSEWNLGIEKQLSTGWALDVEYLGSKGTDLGGRFVVNTGVIPAPGSIASRRRIPIMGSMRLDPHWFNSIYNAGQLKLEHRATHGLTTVIAYTYSHSIDDQSCTHAECGQIQDPLNFEASRGNSLFDITHNLVGSWVWQLPVGRGQRFLSSSRGLLNGVLGGWRASGIASFSTGMPFTISLPYDNANVGFTQQRPSVTSLAALTPPGGKRTPDLWFSPAPLFVTPYTFGNLGRNVLRRDGIQSFDLGLQKLTPLPGREGMNIEFRAEFFNIFNHPVFGEPVDSYGATNLGAVTALTPTITPRDIQFALKLNF